MVPSFFFGVVVDGGGCVGRGGERTGLGFEGCLFWALGTAKVGWKRNQKGGSGRCIALCRGKKNTWQLVVSRLID